MQRLRLDEVWWLVSPQNRLKPADGMAPLATRLASARRVARHPRIRPTAIEQRLGTTATIDTLRALIRRYPHLRFVWMMGADNLLQFHQWLQWREIARIVPIVVFARAPYTGQSRFSAAMGWLGRYVRKNPVGWRKWKLPAIIILDLGHDRRSATSIRRQHPGWTADFAAAASQDDIPQRTISLQSKDFLS